LRTEHNKAPEQSCFQDGQSNCWVEQLKKEEARTEGND